jgi:uncharacterized protein YacL
MKKNQIIIAIIGFLIVMAVLTNPNQDRHKEVLRAKLTSFMQKSMSESVSESDDEWSKAGTALGLMFGGAIVDGIIANVVSTGNYLIFSTTKVTWDGNTRVIGIGAFGNVYITS